jgi:hypothetical protein
MISALIDINSTIRLQARRMRALDISLKMTTRQDKICTWCQSLNILQLSEQTESKYYSRTLCDTLSSIQDRAMQCRICYILTELHQRQHGTVFEICGRDEFCCLKKLWVSDASNITTDLGFSGCLFPNTLQVLFLKSRDTCENTEKDRDEGSCTSISSFFSTSSPLSPFFFFSFLAILFSAFLACFLCFFVCFGPEYPVLCLLEAARSSAAISRRKSAASSCAAVLSLYFGWGRENAEGSSKELDSKDILSVWWICRWFRRLFAWLVIIFELSCVIGLS